MKWNLPTWWRVRNFDGVEVELAPNKFGLDFNRNFPSDWCPEAEQSGAGEYPFSELETRTLAEFITSHPNICSFHSLHTGNDGYLSTHVTEQAIKVKQDMPIEARIQLGEKDALLVGDAKQEIGHLDGYGVGRLRIDRPSEGLRRKKVEWIVHFADQPAARIEVAAKKAGVVRLDLADVLDA